MTRTLIEIRGKSPKRTEKPHRTYKVDRNDRIIKILTAIQKWSRFRKETPKTPYCDLRNLVDSGDNNRPSWLPPSKQNNSTFSTSAIISLKDELQYFCEYVCPGIYELKAREIIVEDLSTIVECMFKRDYKVSKIGSYANGLFIFQSDIDLSLLSSCPRVELSPKDKDRKQRDLFALNQALNTADWIVASEYLFRASVPIIDFTHLSGIEVDVSIDEPTLDALPLYSFISDNLSDHNRSALYTVLAFMKVFLNQQSLDKPFTGGLSSFKLTIMVLSTMVNMAKKICGGVDPSSCCNGNLNGKSRNPELSLVTHDLETDEILVAFARRFEELENFYDDYNDDLVKLPGTDLYFRLFDIRELNSLCLRLQYILKILQSRTRNDCFIINKIINADDLKKMRERHIEMARNFVEHRRKIIQNGSIDQYVKLMEGYLPKRGPTIDTHWDVRLARVCMNTYVDGGLKSVLDFIVDYRKRDEHAVVEHPKKRSRKRESASDMIKIVQECDKFDLSSFHVVQS